MVSGIRSLDIGLQRAGSAAAGSAPSGARPSIAARPTAGSAAAGSAPSGARPSIAARPTTVTALIGDPGYGLTRIGLSMLAQHVGKGPVACLDVRGWFSPLAAWEIGIEPEQLLIVRCGDVVRWGRAAATLLDGVSALYAEVPNGVPDSALRKLGAVARRSRTPLVLRPLQGSVPSGVASLRLEAETVTWHGTDDGHGRLEERRSLLSASGKAVKGMVRRVEVEDDGADVVRVVPDVVVAEARRATG